MKRWLAKLVSRRNIFRVVVLALFSISVLGFSIWRAEPAQAAINEQLTFQARLYTADGGIVADGDYNLEFKIYSGGDGDPGTADETLEWTETRQNSGGNGVRVENGYFNVRLGSVNALPTDIWNNDTLWLSLNVGGTGTGSTPAYDGEMSPFTRLTAVPQAFNADKLDGIDSTQFARTDQNETFNNNVTIQGSTTIGTSSSLGQLTLHDGSSNTGTLETAALGQNTTYQLPDPAQASDTFCLANLANCDATSAGGAPDSADYLTLSSNGNLTSERAFVAGTNLAATDGGANNNYTLNVVDNPTFAGNLTVQGGTATLGQAGTQGQLTLHDGGATDNIGTLQVISSLAQDTTFTLPDPGGATANICLDTGNCDGAGSSITGSGTADQVAYFDGSQNLTSDIDLQFDGTDLNVGGGQLFVDGSTSRVGIGTGSPTSTLDVEGDAILGGRASGNTVTFGGLGGTSNALILDNVTDSNPDLTLNSSANRYLQLSNTGSGTFGLTVDGNVGIGTDSPGEKLDVQGNVEADDFLFSDNANASAQRRYYVSRSLPTTTGDYVDIGSFNVNSGAHSFYITVTVSDSAFSMTKQYTVPVSYNETGNTWTDALPINSTGAYSGNDYVLEINSDNNTVSFRLRRTAGTSAGTALVNIQQIGSSDDTFTAASGTGTSTASGTYSFTQLAQVGGSVGIGTNSPSQKLDVAGNAQIQGNLILNNGTNTGTLTLGSLSTNQTYTLPDSDGADEVCLVDLGNCAGSGSGITGNGTDNQIAIFSGSQSLDSSSSFTFDGADLNVDSNSLFVDGSANRVGIGDGTPDATLDVSGTLHVQGNSSPGIFRMVDTVTEGGSAQDDLLVESAGAVNLKLDNNDNGISGNTGFGIYDGTNNLLFNVLENTGNVGIGTVSPGVELDIQGDSTTDEDILYVSNSNGAEKILLGLASGGGQIVLRDGSNNDDVKFTTQGHSYINAGNVGIGTTSPAKKLHVLDSAVNFPVRFASGDALGGVEIEDSTDRAYFLTQDSKAQIGLDPSLSTNNLTINTSGNVGIGTTSPDEKLEVAGNLKLTDNTLSPTSVTFDSETSTGLRLANTNGYVSLTPLNSGWAHIYTDRSNFIFNKPVYSVQNQFSSYSTGDLELQTGGVTRITAQNSTGNVGIGDTTPSYPLDVAGNAQIQGDLILNNGTYTGTLNLGTLTANQTYTLPDSDGADEICLVDVGNCAGSGSGVTTTGGTDNQVAIFNGSQSLDSSSGLTFDGADFAVGTNQLFVQGSTGNVGIGTTSPDRKLHISGSGFTAAQITGGTPDLRLEETDGNVDENFDIRLSGGSLGFGTNSDLFNNYSEKLTIQQTGNVGIGTTAPGAKMHVFGSSSGASSVYNGTLIVEQGSAPSIQILSANSQTQTIKFGDPESGNRGRIEYSHPEDSLRLVTASGERMRIDSSGNVGIGTTSPNSKLEVAGDLSLQTNKLKFGTSGSEDTNLFRDSADVLRTNDSLTVDQNLTVSSNATVSGTLSVGTSQSFGQLTIGNNQWVTGVDSAGTAGINVFKVNTDDQIQLGSPLAIDGGFTFPEDGGLITFADLPITSASPAGTAHGYTQKLDAENVLSVYGESDGAGGVQNTRVGIGTATPTAKLDVTGGTIQGDSGLNITGGTVTVPNGEIGNLELANKSVSYGGVSLDLGQSDATPAFTLDDATNLPIVAGTTGTLTIGRGGTNGTATPTLGQVAYGDGSAYAFTTGGSSGECLLFNSSAAPTWGNCGGSGSGAVTLQVAYENGNSITTEDNRNIDFNLADTTTDSDFIVDIQGTGNVFDVQDGGSSALTVVDGGNVGIGTNSPGSQLDVVDSSNAEIRVRTTTTANSSTTIEQIDGGDFRIARVGTGGYDFAIQSDGDIELGTQGRVGVGTNSPSEKLHVAGGNLEVSNSTTAVSFTLNRVGTNSHMFLASGSNLYIEPDTTEGDTLFRDFDDTTSLHIDNSSNNVYVPNGNVGIGTTTPSGHLEIKDSTTAKITLNDAGQSGVYDIAANNNDLFMRYGGDNSKIIALQNDGNVGIGTLSPSYKLDVTGNAQIQGDAILNNGTNTGTFTLGALSANQTYTLPNETGTVCLTTGNCDGAGSSITGNGTDNQVAIFSGSQSIDSSSGLTFDGADFAVGTNQLFVQGSSGNVGIGTNSPSNKLTVSDSSTFDAALITTPYSTNLKIESTGTDKSPNISFANDARTYSIGTRGNLSDGFAINDDTAAATRLFINTGGNVGIGTTSPDNKLHVYNSSFQVGEKNNTTGNRTIIDSSGNIEHTYGLNDGSATSNHGRFLLSSNVSSEFESSNDSGGLILRNNIGDWSGVIGDSSTTGGLQFLVGGTSTNQDHDDYSANTAMQILEGGNVGIGEASPSAKLDVVGNAEINGTLNLSDNEVQNVRAIQGTDWDDDTGGTNNKYRLLYRDGAHMFYNGGVVVGSYADGTWSDLADGDLIVEGNVGIGDTSPSQKLTVNGSLSVTGSSGNSVYLWNEADSNWRVGVSDNPGFTRSLATSHVNFATNGGGTDQGFAVGVNGGQSSFEVLGSNHQAYFRGNVGIGTTNPGNTLDVNGGVEVENELQMNGNVTTYHNVTTRDGNGSETGTMKIDMPKTWSNTMMQIRIKGYNYTSGTGAWEVVAAGYNFNGTPSWVHESAKINGRAPFSKVRLAHDGDSNVLLLGDTSTSWNYSKIVVEEFVAGHSSQSGWGSGWSIGLITDESSITNVTTPGLDTFVDTAGNFGIGTTTPNSKLDVQGTVNATDFTCSDCIGAAALGTNSVDSSELVDASIDESHLNASASPTSGQVLSYDGATGFTWVNDQDTDTNLSESEVEGFIFDADNTGTLSSGTLALDSLSHTGTLNDANVGDALTISGGTIDSSSITLQGGTGPTPTDEGQIEWDTDNDRLVVGNGTGQTTFYSGPDDDTTYTAGNDLNLSGTQFNIQSQLDFVSIINRTSANLTLQTSTSGDILVNPAGDFNVDSNSLYVDSSADNVGIGTASPVAKLDVAHNGSGQPAFLLRNGDDSSGSSNKVQLRFGFNGTDDYSHFVTTRHDGAGSNNAIDFYVSDGTQNGTYPTNAVHNLTLQQGNVGIGTTSPTNTLDVDGGIDANTLNTGQGDHELYAMDQDVLTTSAPRFDQLTFPNQTEDKIALYGTLGGPNMYGFGVEASHLYYKSFGGYRWYSGANADGGTSDILELSSAGNLTAAGTVNAADFTCSNCIDAAALGANSVDSSELVNGSVDESHLNIADTPNTGEVLSYNGTTFEWVVDDTNDTDVSSLNNLNGALTLQGTTNQISVSEPDSSTITLSTPQDIADTSSPTFGGLTVNGNVGISEGSQLTSGSNSVTVQGDFTYSTNILGMESINGSFLALDSNNNTSTAQFRIGANDISPDGANWTDILAVEESGNVGIGTTSPGAALQVANGELWLGEDGTTAGKLTLRDSGGVSNEPEIFTDTGGNLTLKAHSSNADLALQYGSNAAYQVTLDGASGNVGIGTSSPSDLLHVKGSTFNSTSSWDLENASYNSKNHDVSSEEAFPDGVVLGDNGNKMYVLGSGATVYEYSLSTPWDITTASFTSGDSFSVSGQESGPRGLAFKDDGTEMYVVGGNSDTVYQYNLSTAWDVTTASFTAGDSFGVSGQDTNPYEVTFGDSGNKMYIAGNNNDNVYQYNLSTAWDITTASFTSGDSFSVSSEESGLQSVFLKDDGKKMYIVGINSDSVHQYSLPTAWDITTASYDNVSFDVSSEMSSPHGLNFGNGGKNMYVVNTNPGVVYQYSTSVSITAADGALVEGTVCVKAAGGSATCPDLKDGSIAAEGSISANAFDIAELYGSNQKIGKGMIVAADPDHAEYVTKAEAGSSVLGITSTKPGFVLGWESNPELAGAPHKLEVALSGRVPVSATDENGQIKPGDQLTLSEDKPGFAAKATEDSTIVIGTALSSLTSSQGQVMVFVNVDHRSPALQKVAEMQLQNGDSAQFSDLNVSGPTTLNQLTVEQATVNSGLLVNGKLTVKEAVVETKLTVNGHIVSKGKAIEITAKQALGKDEVDDTKTTEELIKTKAEVNGTDSAGTIKLKSGLEPSDGALAQATFNKAYNTPPKVLVTAKDKNGALLAVYVQATKDGFTLHAAQKPDPDQTYTFDYFIIGSEVVKE